MNFRPYQPAAIDALAHCTQGILKSPAGSGKTIIAAAALKRVLQEGDEVLWIANTVDQVAQAKEAAKMLGIEIRTRCAHKALIGVHLLRATILVVDECQHASAPVWTQIIEGCTNARIKWGLSATPFPDAERREVIEHLLGRIIHEVPRDAVKNAGGIAEAHVNFIQYNPDSIEEACEDDIEPLMVKEMNKVKYLKYRKHWLRKDINAFGAAAIFLNAARRIYRRYNHDPEARFSKEHNDRLRKLWRDVIEERKRRILYRFVLKRGVNENAHRNQIAQEIISQHKDDGDSILTLVGSIEQGKMIAEATGGEICHSKIGKAKREDMIYRFRAGVLKVMVATSLADEGLDVPRANVLILLSAGKAKHLIEQRTGRVLRAYKDKDQGIIYDFWDDHHFYLEAQSKRRRDLYLKLGYKMRIIKYEIT